ncbi:sensor histidine kinase [Streptomyces sp. NBC_01508]|uniref:sensor histidine kinase n=1 Tax=Streptomyces sp. NBC_01508 TaxID=2903888 RepID=UPI0038641157
MPATASERERRARRPRPVPRTPRRLRVPCPRRPFRRIRWTARLRLTLLYGALFLVSGAALLAITYFLVANGSRPRLFLVGTGPEGELLPKDSEATRNAAKAHANGQRDATLHQLLVQSGVALALMSAVSVVLGWITAGRVLRPVRTMTDKARRISERNLHERLAVTGPADELKDLGDTFDSLLARLDSAFDAQKRFVANASHELRTPLTLQRALIEVALSNPAADARSLRTVCERVLAAGEQQERLIEALLTLARSQRGLERRRPTDLAPVVADALRVASPERAAVVRIERSLAPAWTSGDPRLVERLVTNLVDNALRHNVDASAGARADTGAWIRVFTGTEGGRPVLRVVNSGPAIPPDRIDTLFQPFQRYESRLGGPDGLGLGLSIVAAVATAHGAQVTAVPGPEGGLDIAVAFPARGRSGARAPRAAATAPPAPSRSARRRPPAQ